MDNLTKKTLEQLEKVRDKLHKRDEDIKRNSEIQCDLLDDFDDTCDYGELFDEGA